MKTQFRTKRLLVRRPMMKDVDDIYENVNDKDVVKYLDNIPWPYRKKHAVQYVEFGKKEWITKDGFKFVIEFEDKVVGVIALDKCDKKNKRAILGYSLGKKYWGMGIMTEAVKGLINWGFKEVKLVKILSEIGISNIGPWKIAKKAGMRKVGILEKHYISRRKKWEDCYLFEILREDWKG
jgi:[ribosomal protein S5]-alanine N-acetyltransferase